MEKPEILQNRDKNYPPPPDDFVTSWWGRSSRVFKAIARLLEGTPANPMQAWVA